MSSIAKPDLKERKLAPGPTRFRCKVGGEWQPLSAFSKSQQKLLHYGGRQRANPAHSGMTCRDHTSKTRNELRCEVCGLIKNVDEFSKNSLKNEEYTCKRCVAWTETQEPGVTPAPLETGHVSFEEQAGHVWQREFTDTSDFFVDEHDTPLANIMSWEGSDISDEQVRDLTRKFQGITQDDDSSGGAPLTSRSTKSSCSQFALPPHLINLSKPSSTIEDNSSIYAQSSAASTKNSKLPPHLRPGPSRGSAAGTSSTATTVRKDRQEAKKAQTTEFNAWDSRGARHKSIKEHTLTSSSSSERSINSTRSTVDSKSVHSQFTRGQRVTPGYSFERSTSNAESTNDSAPFRNWEVTKEPEVQFRRGSKWPKASELRIPRAEIKKELDLLPILARDIRPDIDSQKLKSSCDSDDSDF